MSEEILRLKPEEVANFFAEGKMEVANVSEVFDLERFRGPNSTLQLVNLIKDYIGQGMPGENLGHCIKHLQRWAISVDKEILQTALIITPNSRASLEQMVNEIIQRGTISDKLGLSPSEYFNSHKFYDKRSIFFCIPRSDQWWALKVLFNIDTSSLIPTKNGLHLSRALSLKEVHQQMFKLINQAVQKKGHSLESITTPEQVKGIGIDPGTHPLEASIAPSVINGVSVILVTGHTGVTDMEKYGQVLGPSAVDGYPNIEEIALKFDSSFLASVRPLTEDEYRKYVPKE